MNVVHETECSGHAFALALELGDSRANGADDQNRQPAAEGQSPMGLAGGQGDRGGQQRQEREARHDAIDSAQDEAGPRLLPRGLGHEPAESGQQGARGPAGARGRRGRTGGPGPGALGGIGTDRARRRGSQHVGFASGVRPTSGGVVVQCTGLTQQGAVVGLVQQLLVTARGDHAPALHDGDAVGAAHGGRAMGDDQNRAPRDEGAQRLLDLGLGLGIGHGGGLVEQQNGGVQQHGPGDGDALLLAAGQGRVPPKDGVVTIGKGHDLLIDMGDPGGVAHLLQVGVGASQRDVLAHRRAQELGVLEDEGDRGVERLLIHVAQIHPADAHGAGVGVGEAGDESGQRRLARARGAEQSGDGAGLQGE